MVADNFEFTFNYKFLELIKQNDIEKTEVINNNLIEIFSCLVDNDWISSLSRIVTSVLNKTIINGLTHLRNNMMIWDLNDIPIPGRVQSINIEYLMNGQTFSDLYMIHLAD